MQWNTCITLIKEVTSFNSLYLSFFISVLHAFCCHLNIFLTHFYRLYCWSLFWDSLLHCLAFCTNHLFHFYRSLPGLLPHGGGFACGESWSRLLTIYMLSFFVYLYFTFMQLLCGYFLIRFLANFLDDIY